MLILFAMAGCADNRFKTNEEYLDYLASIVTTYQKKHGATPEQFDQALEESGLMLNHRGDLDGRHLSYFNFGEKAFMFRANGENRQSDLGLLDDTDVYFIEMKKVTRDEFIKYSKTNNGGMYWDACGFLFSNQ